MNARLLIMIFACSCGAAAMRAADDKPDPRETLETAAPEAIRMLKAKEYLAFLQTFVSPEEMKLMLADAKKRFPDISLESIAANFGQQKAQSLLLALEGIADADLSMNQEEQIATYKFAKPISGKDAIRFKKIGKFWYLQN